MKLLLAGLVLISFTACANRERLTAGSSGLGSAADLAGRAKVCDDAGGTGRTLQMPIDHFGRSTKKFSYRYQLKPGSKLGPAIVYIPGGPGGTSVADDFVDLFPNAFTRIFVDPRGVGCNFVGDQLPDVAITEENHIMDLVEVVKTLEPAQRDNLYLFGGSYGTIAATLLTQKLESLGILIKATILEGVVGQQNDDAIFSAEAAAVERIYDRLTSDYPTIKDIVDGTATPPNPFGLKGEVVDNFIYAGLYYDYNHVGQLLTRAVELSKKPKPLSDNEQTELDDYISTIKSEGEHGASGLVEGDYGSYRFFTKVRCGNLGRLATEVDFCKGQQVQRGYDPKDYQLKAALYYFQSKMDPATVYEGALYHFENQKAARFKVFTASESFGHVALHYFGQQRDCAESLFLAIYQLKRDFSDILTEDGRCRDTQGDKK